jgi:hypothetical protein
MSNFRLLCYYTLGLGITDEGALRILFIVFNPELRDHKFMMMVTKDGRDLSKIPVNFRSYEICLTAIKQNTSALSSVPNEILDYQLCIITIKKNGLMIYNVPDKFCTYDLKFEAVKQNPFALRQIELSLNNLRPDKQYALCLEAARHGKYWLQWVPKKFHKDIKKELNIK